MNKSASRELAFQLLYSTQIQKEMEEEQFELFCQNNEIEDEKVKAYIKDILFGVKSKEGEIEKLISDNLKKGWNIERISKVDITLLKIAIYEINEKNIPYKIVINEAVELAKKYAEDASPSFINGVLASIIKQNDIKGE
ncbi:MAG TPA: transcription antitermination factor NusB [Clostridiaceae bacterium]|jgi:N utilization substance protein B|nr:transcription antitermination factor NusB [Clostridiaceae bacterium]